MIKRKLYAAVAALALAVPLAHAQSSSDESTRQMRIIVPYSAGGTSDILGRKLAQELTERMGQQVIVENRAGAGGSIGTMATVRAEPDGSTILLHSGAIATEPAIKSDLQYDATKDLKAVTTVVRGPFALLVSKELPVSNVKELVDYAKANPGKVNFGTPGVGTSVHFATEHFKVASGAPLTHIPYKGASAALVALMSNEVQLVIDPLSTAKRYTEDGRLKTLGLTTAERSDLWPGMQTISESGVDGFDAAVWYGLYVPSKTPDDVVARLNKEFVEILKTPEMREWLSSQGLEPVGDTPAEAQEFLVKDIAHWKDLAKTAGIKVD